MRKAIILFILILSFDTMAANKINIGFSKISGEPSSNNYVNWILKFIPNANCINLYSLSADSLEKYVKSCRGIVLTGGEDVHPGNFGKADQVELCEMDLLRDTIEFQIIKFADKFKIPMLGICRGEQILNVAYGGSLIVDIPSQHKSKIKVNHRDSLNKNLPHKISVKKGSFLNKITGKRKGEVNSSHHQAIDKLGKGLKAVAFSQDGIVEAIERKKKTSKPFFLAVQWHPERWENKYFSDRIGKSFAKAVKKYKKIKTIPG
jgi:putative glutamine amidotransferase